MATIIDALLVTLSLDPSGFVKGQKEATAAFKKTREEADSFGKGIESSGKKAAESIAGVARQALQLFGILAGAKSVADFASHISNADAALGRLAVTLGVAPDKFAAWTMAVERNGGSAEAAANSFRALSDSFEELKRTGSTGILNDLYRLQGAGGANIDIQHGFIAALPGIIKNLETIKRLQGATSADAYARSVGLDPGTANFLEQGQPKVDADVAESKRIGLPTPAQIKIAQDLQRAWITLQQTATSLGRDLLDKLAPSLTKILDAITDLIQKNPKLVEGMVAFLALFSAAKIAAVVGSIFKFRSALLALGDASVMGSLAPLAALLARLGLVGAVGATAVDAYEHSTLNEGEDEIARQKKYGQSGDHLGGNDALRRRSGGKDINLGAPGKLSANQQEAYKAAREGGLSETAARALVANMSGEGLPHDAHRVHWDSTHYAHGIVQWDDDRSAAIKRQFGKMPEEMSVAEQTKAAIWEINNNPRFAKTKRALEGGNAGAMIGALVGNYESPGDVGSAIAKRSKIYQSLGNLRDAAPTAPAGSAAPGAHTPPASDLKAYGDLSGHPLNEFHSSTPVMPGTLTSKALRDAMRKLSPDQLRRVQGLTHVATSHSVVGGNTSSSNVNVGAIHVSVPNGDAKQIAKSIRPAVERHSFTTQANSGPY